MQPPPPVQPIGNALDPAGRDHFYRGLLTIILRFFGSFRSLPSKQDNPS
jgi:hypothetical protein